MLPIHPNSVLSAFAEVDGDAFERFFKEFGPSVFGLSFTPLGRRHDGGADAFSDDDGLFASSRRLTFFQASVQENHRSKIKKTIDRIREFGREIGTLSYFTSRIISEVDNEALALSNLHDVTITIYDGQWIANRINTDLATQSAFENHLKFYAGMIADQRRNSSIIVPTEFNLNAAVFVSQHSLMSPSGEGIRGVVLDSLALFVLEEATIEGHINITSIDIYSRMRSSFPAGFNFSDAEVAERLALMSTRQHPNGRQVVWDEREAGYSLPFDARMSIASEHAAFEALIFRVREEVRTAIGDVHETQDIGSTLLGRLVSAAMRALELLFIDEGLRVAQFLDGAEEDLADATVQDMASRALREAELGGKDASIHLSAVMEAMRRIFYQTTEDQRKYLSYLSRTYALMFSMKYDLKLSSYFSDMKSHFRLLVGADVMIQALSESRLSEDDRATHAMIRALRTAGAELILTDYAVDEVYTHIVAANEEYLNHYAPQDQYITMQVAWQSDRILIRAYFYSKIAPPAPSLGVKSWSQFVNQFLPYTEIRTAEARIALRTYLREKFGLRSETKSDLEEAINKDDLNKLTRKLLNSGIKDKRELAINDAAHILLVYSLRSEAREVAKASPVGYRTWWLTSETRVQRAFEDLIAQNGKAIMRPQVATQLLSFAPNADEVRLAYGAIMPSLVGIRLGNRAHPQVLRSMLDRVAAVSADDPARMKAEMERLANRLKSDERQAAERQIG